MGREAQARLLGVLMLLAGVLFTFCVASDTAENETGFFTKKKDQEQGLDVDDTTPEDYGNGIRQTGDMDSKVQPWPEMKSTLLPEKSESRIPGGQSRPSSTTVQIKPSKIDDDHEMSRGNGPIKDFGKKTIPLPKIPASSEREVDELLENGFVFGGKAKENSKTTLEEDRLTPNRGPIQYSRKNTTPWSKQFPTSPLNQKEDDNDEENQKEQSKPQRSGPISASQVYVKKSIIKPWPKEFSTSLFELEEEEQEEDDDLNDNEEYSRKPQRKGTTISPHRRKLKSTIKSTAWPVKLCYSFLKQDEEEEGNNDCYDKERIEKTNLKVWPSEGRIRKSKTKSMPWPKRFSISNQEENDDYEEEEEEIRQPRRRKYTTSPRGQNRRSKPKSVSWPKKFSTSHVKEEEDNDYDEENERHIGKPTGRKRNYPLRGQTRKSKPKIVSWSKNYSTSQLREYEDDDYDEGNEGYIRKPTGRKRNYPLRGQTPKSKPKSVSWSKKFSTPSVREEEDNYYDDGNEGHIKKPPGRKHSLRVPTRKSKPKSLSWFKKYSTSPLKEEEEEEQEENDDNVEDDKYQRPPGHPKPTHSHLSISKLKIKPWVQKLTVIPIKKKEVDSNVSDDDDDDYDDDDDDDDYYDDDEDDEEEEYEDDFKTRPINTHVKFSKSRSRSNDLFSGALKGEIEYGRGPHERNYDGIDEDENEKELGFRLMSATYNNPSTTKRNRWSEYWSPSYEAEYKNYYDDDDLEEQSNDEYKDELLRPVEETRISNSKKGNRLENTSPAIMVEDGGDVENKQEGQEEASHDLVIKNATTLPTGLRLLCLVNTTSSRHKLRATAVKNTWGRKCNQLIFVSDIADSFLPSVKVDINVVHGYAWAKTKEVFKYIQEHYEDHFDWVLKAEDSTFVIVENLLRFLASYDPSEKLYMGCRLKFEDEFVVDHSFMSARAGYVLSRAAVEALVEEALPNPNICTQESGWYEDIEMSKCLQNVGVKMVDTRDSKGRHRFLHYALGFSGLPQYLDDHGEWISKHSFYPMATNFECCSDTLISSHYPFSMGDMYLFEYLLYNVGKENFTDRITRRVEPTIEHEEGPLLMNVKTNLTVKVMISKKSKEEQSLSVQREGRQPTVNVSQILGINEDLGSGLSRDLRYRKGGIGNGNLPRASKKMPRKRLRLLCLIVITDYHEEAFHVRNTWGKRCPQLLFMSYKNDSSLPSVTLSTLHYNMSDFGAAKEAFEYVYHHYLNSVDWVIKVHQFRYIVVENLMGLLSKFNASEKLYVGPRMHTPIHSYYIEKNTGYALSRGAIRALVEEGLSYNKPCRQDDGGDENIEMGECLHSVGVRMVDQRDRIGRHRFVLNFRHLAGVMKDQAGDFHSYYPIKSGFDCCSYGLTSIGSGPVHMFEQEFLLHRLKYLGMRFTREPVEYKQENQY